MGSLERSEADTLAALRSGDEAAFVRLVDELSPGLLRMARVYVSTDAAAEEVLQETWLGVLRGLERFEGRSTLKTWIYRILINVAKTRGVRDSRSLPFSSAFAGAVDDEEGLGPDRFLGADHDRYPGHWAVGPLPWPADALENAEALRVIAATVERLPARQREVITLRDVVGCTAAETCDALGLSENNQRVLLHRARTRVRAALEKEFDATEPTL
ncbi:MAG TPA: sigma-70 family RNA polymerase sigma factor [Thermoleophilaceae bacterium]|nr:sigma-70 family RNA polymerase sigma factor [Thermoleophilaceae bacterium]